jgi:hypothetical protein
VNLVFEAPSDKMKFLHPKLPAAALPGDGPATIRCEIHPDDMRIKYVDNPQRESPR